MLRVQGGQILQQVLSKRAYAKRMHLRMSIILLHRHLCPLLKQWRQVKQGRATVASCVENHLLFLQRCDPLREILDRNDFVDDYVE